jgi:hypothetical protein
MQRADTTDGLYHDGDPETQEEGTDVYSAHLNAMSEELCNIVESEDMTLDENDNTQVLNALIKAISGARGPIFGLELSRGGNQILNIGTGSTWSTDGLAIMKLSTASFNKNINAVFAVGSGNGCLDTGTLAASAAYHVWLIKNPTTKAVEVLINQADVSALNPTLPTGFTKKQRLGTIRTDASKYIINFVQFWDIFVWKNPPLDFDYSTLNTSYYSQGISTPPDVRCLVLANIVLNHASADRTVYIYSPEQDLEAASLTSAPLAEITINASGGTRAGQILMLTNTSNQVGLVSSGDNTNFRFSTALYVDRRII